MKKIQILSHLRLVIEVVLILAVAAVLVSRYAPTRAADQAPEAPAATNWYVCNTPAQVAVFPTRIHVYCTTTTPAGGGVPAMPAAIHWFAFPTSPDSAAASRFMSLLQTAYITGRAIWLFADPNDTTGSSFGCNSGDCRRIYGLEMQ